MAHILHIMPWKPYTTAFFWPKDEKVLQFFNNKIVTCTNLNKANAGELSSGNMNPINEYN